MLLSSTCHHSSLSAFSLPGPEESCSPTKAKTKANPQLPHSICFSPSPTPPRHGVGEGRKGVAAEPRLWDHWLPLFLPCPQPLALSGFLPCPPTPETLLTPSDNTQHHAHFHKYKASRVGQKGRQKRGLRLPPFPGAPFSYPQHPVPLDQTSAFHLLSK